MTATINVYQLPQVVALTMGGNTGATLMNYPINRTDFNLTKGVKTEIMFFIRDVDRKVVFLTTAGSTPRVVITDPRDRKMLLERELTVVNAAKGLWMLTVASVDIEFWPLGYLQYSIVVEQSNGDDVMLYTDRAYGPYSSLQVLPGPYPEAPEATTVPMDQFTYQQTNTILVSGAFNGGASVGNVLGLHTFAWTVENFVGDLIVQASLEGQPSSADYDWFDAQTLHYDTAVTGTFYAELTGHFLWIRFMVKRSTQDSTLEKVVFRAV